MRRKWIAALVVAGLAAASAVQAGTSFAAYEGRDSVVEGKGGARVTRDGIDFWTMGDPPHRYQVLGVLTDQRGGGLFSGDAVGSSGVAARVKELGGDAVIVMDRSSQVKGVVFTGSVAGVARRNTTQLLVVKYLDKPAEAPAQPSSQPPAAH